jgi:hypothetical protein
MDERRVSTHASLLVGIRRVCGSCLGGWYDPLCQLARELNT